MNNIKKIILICTCLVLAICQINTKSFAATYKEGSYDKKAYGWFKNEKEKLAPKAKIIYTKLVQAGATYTGACAMLGNIHQESRFNPKTENYLKCYGIVQWKGNRRKNLEKRYPNNYNTVEGQADFLVYELKNSYKSTWTQMSTATEDKLVDTTEYIRIHFEVCGPANVINTKRVEYAIGWFNYFKGTSVVESSPTPTAKTQVSSEKTESLKEQLDYQEGVPSEYDVEVKAEELGKTIALPVIGISIEDILYSEQSMFTIDFLANKTTINNTESGGMQETWDTYRDMVRSMLRSSLYITAATLITLLMYIAIIIVKNGIFSENGLSESEKQAKSPGRFKFGKKMLDTFNPKDAKKEKEFVQEWIKSTFLIIFIVLIINLINSFTNVLTKYIADFNHDEKKITVYVIGDGDDVKDFSFKTNLEGFCLFMSQYNWDDYGMQNFSYIISGIIIAVLKLILYFIFVCRMYIAGVFIAIAPFVIVINSYKKISGEEHPSLLNNWLKYFLFLAFFRAFISMVYYVIFDSNPHSLAKNPVYIILLFIAMGVSIFVYIRLAFKIDVRKIGKKK